MPLRSRKPASPAAQGPPGVVPSPPALDEAAGDAAVRVGPDDVDAIAAGIERAIAKRGELVPLGLEHAGPVTGPGDRTGGLL